MTDETGHQLPNIIYPGLDRGELVEWVERFYGEYYFRPRVIWRVVRKAIFNSDERKRLTKEAREYMALRAKRKKFVADQQGGQAARPSPSVPATRRPTSHDDHGIRAAAHQDLDLRHRGRAEQRLRQFLPEEGHAWRSLPTPLVVHHGAVPTLGGAGRRRC